MHSKLEHIINEKIKAVSRYKRHLTKTSPEINLLSGRIIYKNKKSLLKKLSETKPHIIAEIKRASPSKGKLASIENAAKLAQIYTEYGASAISVLTDKHFSGCITDLRDCTHQLQHTSTPILRKDFIIDPIQIAEAAHVQANAVLLIVAILQDQTKYYLEICHQLNLDALVEIHNEKELDIAFNAGAKIIGVNNRNLADFSVDPNNALRLIEKIPSNIIKVAESGIHSRELAKHYFNTGYNALLIGEALVTSNNPGHTIKEFDGSYINE